MWMRHGTHVNTSWHTCVMAHKWTCHSTHVKTSRNKREWVTAHMWMIHGTHASSSYTQARQRIVSWLTPAWTMANTVGGRHSGKCTCILLRQLYIYIIWQYICIHTSVWIGVDRLRWNTTRRHSSKCTCISLQHMIYISYDSIYIYTYLSVNGCRNTAMKHHPTPQRQVYMYIRADVYIYIIWKVYIFLDTSVWIVLHFPQKSH